MLTDLDIFRSAAALSEHHGEGAAMEAAKRTDGRYFAGDHEGTAVWLAIMSAIEKIQKVEPDGRVH